jgi:hypothetical protein
LFHTTQQQQTWKSGAADSRHAAVLLCWFVLAQIKMLQRTAKRALEVRTFFMLPLRAICFNLFVAVLLI